MRVTAIINDLPPDFGEIEIIMICRTKTIAKKHMKRIWGIDNYAWQYLSLKSYTVKEK